MSRPLRVLSVFGTRPEAIKMAPVIRALAEQPGIEHRVCVTGQHREMLDQVLTLFGIKPDHDFAIMRAGQGPAYVTSAVLEHMAAVLEREKPDCVLVQGDTMSAFAGALAAFYAQVPVGHVEAGLRTGNMMSPWPEEMNRVQIGRIARLHFPPTAESGDNLRREGVPENQILVTGNTVIDAMFDALAILDSDPARHAAVDAQLPPPDGTRRLILVTGHRRENFDGGLDRVAQGLRQLADRGDVEIVYPVHLNPNVQQVATALLTGHPRIRLIPPLDYLPFLALMRRADLIITDSGGVQEEAPSLGKPVLVTRDTTERPEAVAVGTVELVGTDTERLVRRASRLLDDPAAYAAMSAAHNPYGDGHAAGRIVGRILAEFTPLQAGV